MRDKSKRVLIIDPHAEVLMRLQKVLEDAGFDTETAWSGADAMQLLFRDEFDIVLVSDYLPDCECVSVLRQIAQKFGNVACVVMQSFAPRMNESDRFMQLRTSAVVCKHDLPAVIAAVTREAKSNFTVSREKLRAAG